MKVGDYINRKNIEVMMVKHFNLNDYVDLYHGSMVKTDVIKPMSLNVGTRLTGVRSSSFWTDQRMYSIIHVIGRHLSLYQEEKHFRKRWFYLYHGEKVSVNERYKKEILKYLSDKKLYIYHIRTQYKNLSIGNSKDQPEFTIEYEVTPDDYEEFSFKDFSPYIIFEPEDIFEVRKKEYMDAWHNRKYRLVENVLYYDWDEVLKKRKKIRESMKLQK